MALNQFHEWQASYDTLKLAIEKCPSGYQFWRAFTFLTNDVKNLWNGESVHDSVLWTDYQDWLHSVLYLNTTDPNYFCHCVEQIYPYVGQGSDSEVFMDGNVSVMLLRWLLLNTDCDTALQWSHWQSVRRTQRQLWENDSIGGLHYPYDTTIPPLSKFGLDTLFSRHFLYSVSADKEPAIFASAVASPNPAVEGTLITFGLSKEAYVKIELYDLLGHRVEIPPMESLFEAGNHAIPLSLHGLPSGTYYARLVTAYGEAQTVKIVKD